MLLGLVGLPVGLAWFTVVWFVACGLGCVVWMCLAVLCFSLLLASVAGCFGFTDGLWPWLGWVFVWVCFVLVGGVGVLSGCL